MWLDWLRGRGEVLTAESRWVVVDVETSGLDTSSDRLIALGAVALHGARVAPGDSLELVVRQAETSSTENILVHGVGRQAQLAGVEPGRAAREFVRFVGRAPLLAFHAPFDRSFTKRFARRQARHRLSNPWLDLAELAPALFPRTGCTSLDDWLAHFAIPPGTRHCAAADAFSTALLAARLLAEAQRQGALRWGDLQSLAASARWVK